MYDAVPTVLVVDDELFSVDILVEYLEDTGYEVETAIDGQSAWELLKAKPERFDVVILDRLMTGLNGVGILKRIKAHPILQRVPVILQTARAANEEDLEGLRAVAYLLPADQTIRRGTCCSACCRLWLRTEGVIYRHWKVATLPVAPSV